MKYLSLSALSLAFAACNSWSAPWVDSSDLYLRADIDALASAGVITVPVNTFPLMWSGIGADLAKAEPALMSADVAAAYSRVNYYYRQAVDNQGNSRVKAAVATDAARFQHFGSDYREKAELKASHEYTGNRFAYKLSASLNYHPEDSEVFRPDDSWGAVILGNWMLSAGFIEQWWGPGFDTALHRSTNARPMPSVMLSRNNAAAFETPWLSWIGPWTLTTGFSWMNDERAIEDTLLWNFRTSIRPLEQLELGASWTAQMCGEGQDCGFGVFWDTISGGGECADGSVDCDPALNSRLGNQVAGFDIRYSDTWFDVPVGMYLERTCEDASGPLQPADCARLVGVDTRFGNKDQQYKLFLEYTNTLVACGEDSNSFNCFYEHSTYLSGSRYYGRALGSTYDSDAKTWVLGLVGQFSDSKGMNAFLRYAQLNNDGISPANEWVPQLAKEDLLMLELSYRQPLLKGMVTLGGTVSRSEFETTSSNDATFYGSYEYRF